MASTCTSVNKEKKLALGSNQSSRPTPQKRPRPANNSDTHSISKRPVPKPIQRKNDVYITNKTNFNVQLKQCTDLLQKAEVNEVFLHSVGNAIARTINLALNLVDDSNGGLGYEANTSTIHMIDNLHPLHDDEDFSIQQRLNSCLHVRVFRLSKELLLMSAAATNKEQL